MVFTIGVTYGTPEDQVAEIPRLIEVIIRQRTDVRVDRAHFSGFGPSSLDFEVVYTVTSPDYGVHMDARQQIYLGIYRAFNERDIDFAFPTQTLHLVDASAAQPAADAAERRGGVNIAALRGAPR